MGPTRRSTFETVVAARRMRLDPTPSLHSIVNGLNCPYNSPTLIAFGFTTSTFVCNNGRGRHMDRRVYRCVSPRDDRVSSKHARSFWDSNLGDTSAGSNNCLCTRWSVTRPAWRLLTSLDSPAAIWFEFCPPCLARSDPLRCLLPPCSLELVEASCRHRMLERHYRQVCRLKL